LNVTLPANTSDLSSAAHSSGAASPLQKTREDYVFVSNVRFLSMGSVVAVHAIEGMAGWVRADLSSPLMRATLQILKFGTIDFFLISGFLMGEGLTRRAPKDYLKRRIRTVLTPWLLWFSLFCAKTLAGDIYHGRLGFDSAADLAFIFNQIKNCLFGTAFWFVPNLMIAICVLLICRRFLFDFRFGCLLLTLSLFYAANVHTGWIPLSGHAEALFGFVFFLWLGATASNNFSRVQAWLARIPASALMLVVLLTGVAAYVESEVLTSMGKVDNVNSLRVSNQIYSVAMAVTTLKAKSSLAPRGINVRSTTFGIYLIHTIVLSFLFNFAIRALPNPRDYIPLGMASVTVLCLALAGFAIAYGASLMLTRGLIKFPRLRWTVGAFAADWRAATGPGRMESRASSAVGNPTCNP
jgi:peptidoglycan/LPS O-acetylase OafA/YrhL